VAVIAVGPPEVVALRDLHQLLGGIVRVGLVGEAPVLAQLIAPVNRGPHRARTRLHAERLGVPKARRPAAAIPERLPCPVGREPPDPGAALELGAWVAAGGPRGAVRLLAAVG